MNKNNGGYAKEIKGIGKIESYKDVDVAYRIVEDSKDIKISLSRGEVYYSATIHHDGTFDYDCNLSNSDKKTEKGLNGALISQYDHDSIKKFVESEGKSDAEISYRLYEIILEIVRIAGIFSLF